MKLTGATIEVIMDTKGAEEHGALVENMETVHECVENIRVDLEHYDKVLLNVEKLSSASVSEIFVDHMAELKDVLDTMQFAITGETLAVALQISNKLDVVGEQMEGVEGKVEHIEDMIRAKEEKDMKHERRSQAMNSLTIDERDGDWTFEDKPFAK